MYFNDLNVYLLNFIKCHSNMLSMSTFAWDRIYEFNGGPADVCHF